MNKNIAIPSLSSLYLPIILLLIVPITLILKDSLNVSSYINIQKDLFYYIVSNATSSLNYLGLAKKINIDAKTIKEYINYFEDNF